MASSCVLASLPALASRRGSLNRLVPGRRSGATFCKNRLVPSACVGPSKRHISRPETSRKLRTATHVTVVDIDIVPLIGLAEGLADAVAYIPAAEVKEALNFETLPTLAAEPDVSLTALAYLEESVADYTFMDATRQSSYLPSWLVAVLPSWVTSLNLSDHLKGIILLNIMTALMGSNIAVVKAVQDQGTLDPTLFLAGRFLVATAAFSPFFADVIGNETAITAGVELGVWSSLAYVTQSLALMSSGASSVSFLSTLTVVTVPLLATLCGSRLPKGTWPACSMALFGIYLLEVGGSGVGELAPEGVSVSTAAQVASSSLMSSSSSHSWSGLAAMPVTETAAAATASPWSWISDSLSAVMSSFSSSSSSSFSSSSFSSSAFFSDPGAWLGQHPALVGDAWAILSALMFAVQLIRVEHLSHHGLKSSDTRPMIAVQLATVAAACCGLAAYKAHEGTLALPPLAADWLAHLSAHVTGQNGVGGAGGVTSMVGAPLSISAAGMVGMSGLSGVAGVGGDGAAAAATAEWGGGSSGLTSGAQGVDALLQWTRPQAWAGLGEVAQSLGVVPILYTGIISTALMLWCETVALQWVNASEAALIYALDPVWGAGMAYIFLGERWGTLGWAGAAMIIGASLLPQIYRKGGEDDIVESTVS